MNQQDSRNYNGPPYSIPEIVFDFVNGAGYGENEAILNRKTGQLYLLSDYCDMDEMEQLADEDFDSAIHIYIPHKNDLDLGRNLVFEFVDQFMPDDYEKVSQIFRKKGGLLKI